MGGLGQSVAALHPAEEEKERQLEVWIPDVLLRVVRVHYLSTVRQIIPVALEITSAHVMLFRSKLK